MSYCYATAQNFMVVIKKKKKSKFSLDNTKHSDPFSVLFFVL